MHTNKCFSLDGFYFFFQCSPIMYHQWHSQGLEIQEQSARAGADSCRFPCDITTYYRMTTRRGLSLDVIDVVGHEVGMERTVLRTRTTSALVIGRPRPLQILGYRRISPGFWWLSNASALAFEHRECSERDTVVKREEEQEERERE